MIEGGLKNPEINHPLNDETISTTVLILSILAMLLILLAYRAVDLEKRSFGINAMIREMLWSWTLSLVITASAKLYVGRPRPNFYALTEDGKEIKAYKSFPSGHASSAMSTYGLVCIHFVENVLLQLRGIKVPTDRLDASQYGWLWNLFMPITRWIGPSTILVALLPGFFAFFIACSRIHDYYHFAADAITGAIIGISSALLSFSMFRKQASFDFSPFVIEDMEVPKRGPKMGDDGLDL